MMWNQIDIQGCRHHRDNWKAEAHGEYALEKSYALIFILKDYMIHDKEQQTVR